MVSVEFGRNPATSGMTSGGMTRSRGRMTLSPEEHRLNSKVYDPRNYKSIKAYIIAFHHLTSINSVREKSRAEFIPHSLAKYGQRGKGKIPEARI